MTPVRQAAKAAEMWGRLADFASSVKNYTRSSRPMNELLDRCLIAARCSRSLPPELFDRMVSDIHGEARQEVGSIYPGALGPVRPIAWDHSALWHLLHPQVDAEAIWEQVRKRRHPDYWSTTDEGAVLAELVSDAEHYGPLFCGPEDLGLSDHVATGRVMGSLARSGFLMGPYSSCYFALSSAGWLAATGSVIPAGFVSRISDIEMKPALHLKRCFR